LYAMQSRELFAKITMRRKNMFEQEILDMLETDAPLKAAWDDCIIAGFRGSIAHGTYDDITGIDDVDVMGVMVPKLSNYIGLHSVGQIVREPKDSKWDFVIYEVRKYIRLLIKANPNVLSLLWLPDHLYLKRTLLGDLLISNRQIFMTRALHKSFGGYANAQLHKMTHFAKGNGYMGKKRKALVAEHGYDTKNASHLVRLLRMGIEIKETGILNVVRPDAMELLDIKRGKWLLKDVEHEANRLFVQFKEIDSVLPAAVDEAEAERLLMKIITEHLGVKV